jgi:class 3 adenylate cyclase
VATGGTTLDPVIVDQLMRPVAADGGLSDSDEELLRFVAEGRPIKAIAIARKTTPGAVADAIEALFLQLAREASSGTAGGLRRLRLLHTAIVDREEQGETLSRLLPGGVAEKLARDGKHIGESEMVEVTVMMSDIRGYTTIAEKTPPAALASQLNEHRAEMNRAILGVGGTVMQFVGDAVMAVFGAPLALAEHAQRSVEAATLMHDSQAEINGRWISDGLPPFGLGIGLSTGVAAAALLGSEERLEYTLVGDTVNLAQRLQQWATEGETVLSDATWAALPAPLAGAVELEPALVKGRSAPVSAWRLPSRAALAAEGGTR